jgi:hypothetical protein
MLELRFLECNSLSSVLSRFSKSPNDIGYSDIKLFQQILKGWHDLGREFDPVESQNLPKADPHVRHLEPGRNASHHLHSSRVDT